MPLEYTDPAKYGVPKIFVRPEDGWQDKENVLYRGDRRSPEQIKADGGFRPWDSANPDLRKHVGGDQNGFVSTSTEAEVGRGETGSGRLYVIQAPGGILTDPTMAAAGDRGRGESEVLFPGGIDWRYVAGWHKVSYDSGPPGRYVDGPFEPNPDFIGNQKAADPTPTAQPDQRTAGQGTDRDQQSSASPRLGDESPREPDRAHRDAEGFRTPSTQPPAAQSPGRTTPHQPNATGSPANALANQASAPARTSPNGFGHPPGANQPRPTTPYDQGRPSPFGVPPQGTASGAPMRHSDAPDGQSFGPEGSAAVERREQERQEHEAKAAAEADSRRAEQQQARERTDQAAKPERPLGQRLGELSDERLDKVREHIQKTDAGMSIFDRSEGNERHTANQVAPIPGAYVVDMHGAERHVKAGRSTLTADDVADIMRANPDWDGKTPILLIGCGTGKLPDGFAAELAKKTGVEVIAPTTDAWVDYDGNVFASQSRNTYEGPGVRPGWPPNGEWHTFGPDGSRKIDESPFPPGHTPRWGTDGKGDLPQEAPKGAARRGDDDRSRDGAAERPGEKPPQQSQPQQRGGDSPGQSTDGSEQSADQLRHTDGRAQDTVDAARQAAALTRTDTGDADPGAVADLLNGLPSLRDDSPDSIRELVATVFGGDVTLEPVGGHGGRARTTRPVYQVMVDGEPVGYVKVVPDGAEFASELSAADRLHKAELTSFTVPDVLAVASVPGPDGTRRGALFSALAPGDPVDGLLRRVPMAWDRDRAMDDLRRAVTGVAEGMAELHRGGDRQASPAYLNPHADSIRGHLSELDARRPILDRLGIDLDKINAAMDATIADAMADPGPAGLAHGDAHLGNFLWDADAGVALIDAPTLHQSMDAAGSPIGTPARDVALFTQRIGHFGSEFGLSPAAITQLRGDFADAYARNGGPTVPAPVRAMFDARAATHRLARAVTRLEDRPDPRRAADVGAATAALQDALNLDSTAATELADSFAGELPGTPEFRRAWIGIDNFRSYMLHTADPATRERFEAEYADRIHDLQSHQTKQFKTLWKQLFLSKADEYALSPEGSRRAAELINRQVLEAEKLMTELEGFAASTGEPALAEGKAASTIDREGATAWEASFRETQAKINDVLANPDFKYRGHEIGYIGSMQTGMRGAHKGKTRFDPYDFDVDLYVVVDQETFNELVATYPGLDSDDIKIMPDDIDPPDVVWLGKQIGQALKRAFPHVRGIEESVIAVRAEQPW